MLQTSKIEGRVRGRHLNGISFSLYPFPRVPTALIRNESAFLETRSFHADPKSALEFIYKTCTANLRPHGERTRWSDKSILKMDTFGFNAAILKIGEEDADQMSFSMKTLYPDEDKAANFFLRTEIEYQSPAFYLFQLAEFRLAKSYENLTVTGGVAATLIAGNATLFGYIANRYNILRHGEIKLEDATTLANGIQNEEMSLIMTRDGCIYQSEPRGYGYDCNGLMSDNVPNVSVKFSERGTNISTLHEHKLGLNGPSITMTQNMPIEAYEAHDSVIPIVKDLVLAAAYMCPTLPLSQAI